MSIVVMADTHVLVAVEMLEELDFTKRSFCKNWLIEDLGDLFYSYLLVCLSIGSGTVIKKSINLPGKWCHVAGGIMWGPCWDISQKWKTLPHTIRLHMLLGPVL